MSWDPFLMKKLIKNEICGSMNSTRMYCSQKTSQMLRLLFMYRTWTVATSGEKTREKKKKKKKRKTPQLKRRKREPKHTLIIIANRLPTTISITTKATLMPINVGYTRHHLNLMANTFLMVCVWERWIKK